MGLSDLEDAIVNENGSQDLASDGGMKRLNVLGEQDDTWSPEPYILDWYKKVCNIHLKDSLIKEVDQNFKLSNDLEPFFTPAKLPAAIWSSLKSHKKDLYEQRSLFNVQNQLYTAIKPLLSSIELTDNEEIKSNLTNSIQLLCSSNLDLNRFRRALSAPHLKPELKSAFMRLPVTQCSLFGEDFEKSSKKVVKEVAATNNVMKPKTSYKNSRGKNFPVYQQPFRASRGYRGGRGKSFPGRFQRPSNRGARSSNSNFEPLGGKHSNQ